MWSIQWNVANSKSKMQEKPKTHSILDLIIKDSMFTIQRTNNTNMQAFQWQWPWSLTLKQKFTIIEQLKNKLNKSNQEIRGKEKISWYENSKHLHRIKWTQPIIKLNTQRLIYMFTIRRGFRGAAKFSKESRVIMIITVFSKACTP